jgi:hypothetical protein
MMVRRLHALTSWQQPPTSNSGLRRQSENLKRRRDRTALSIQRLMTINQEDKVKERMMGMSLRLHTGFRKVLAISASIFISLLSLNDSKLRNQTKQQKK